MTDDELRRRLFWQQLGELLIFALCFGFAAYLVAGMLLEIWRTGQVTLYAGGRGSPKVPVHLSVLELPLGVAGAILLFVSFAVGLMRFVAGPAYHVLRTGLPSLGLQRRPRLGWLQSVASMHLGLVLLLAFTGTALVAVQYFFVAVGR